MELRYQNTQLLNGNPLIAPNKFSITSNDVLENYNRLLTQVKDPSMSTTLEDVTKEQNADEITLVDKTSVCNFTLLSGIRNHIGGLQANQMKNITQGQLQNHNAMQSTQCTIDSIFYTSPYDVGSLYLNNRIRLYIHNLRQIGGESANGYALLGDFENAKDMLIVKTSKHPNEDDLLHELVIGLYGTNKLRQYVPNFSYIYGGFKCSPPLIDPDTKKVVSWCLNNQNAVNYVLYENINPSVSMATFIKTCTGKDFLNIYMQILYALRLAFKLIDFTHYDLHNENVLLRTIDKEKFQIAYETERGVEYIITDRIPVIIDYGYSHMVYETKHFGKNGGVPFSIFSYRSWIIHDLYKFLMFCLMSAFKYENQSVITEATKIFRFFNATEDPLVAVNEQYVVRYAFPLNDVTNNITIDDLANYIRKTCNCDFIQMTRANYPLLDCETLCETSDSILTQIGVNPKAKISVPDNVIEFYDLEIRLQNEGLDTERLTLAKNFNYENAMRAHILKMKKYLDTIIELRYQIKLIDLTRMTKDELLTYRTMALVRSSYISIGSISDTSIEFRFYHEIGTSVATSFNDMNAVTIMDDMVIRYNRDVLPSLLDVRTVLVHNHQYLNSIQNESLIIESLQKDRRLLWYWDSRKLFDLVFGSIPTNYPTSRT